MCSFHACYSCVLQFTSPTLTPTLISTLRVSRAFEIYVNDPVLSDSSYSTYTHTPSTRRNARNSLQYGLLVYKVVTLTTLLYGFRTATNIGYTGLQGGYSHHPLIWLQNSNQYRVYWSTRVLLSPAPCICVVHYHSL